ncbi:MAG: VWA domain-containing protein, partial [Desulfobulbaceae bacterium]|nr:VWA domain-containing protein [Desulfobulbaceae bacterium]
GDITITAAGATAAVNDFEAAPNSGNYDVDMLDDFGATTTATITLNETNVDDAPILDLDMNDSSGSTGANFQTTFTEGNGGISITDDDILITDINNANIENAVITITNVEADDLLTVGSLPSGITAGSYDSATGTITLTGSATLADYQNAIRAIQYDNIGNSIGTSRQIEVTVNDGQNDSNTAVSTININTLPTVSIDDISVQEPSSGTTTMIFTVSVDQAPDSNLTFDYQTLDVSAIAGSDYVGVSGTGTIFANQTSTTITVIINSDTNVFEGNESFTLNLSGFNQPVNFDSGSHFTSDGIQGIGNIGANNGVPDAVDDSFTMAPTDTELITGNVLVNDILIDGATYDSHDATSAGGGTVIYNNDGTFTYTPATNLTGTEDTFTYTIIDADGETDTATVTINVTNAVIHPPVVSLVPDNSYTENNSPTNILSGISLTDVDSSTLSSVVVRIDGYIGSQDVLDYLTAGTSVNASVSQSGTTWELTLTNGTDINEYVSVLNTLTYENSSDNPSASTRNITVEAYDATDNSLFGSDSGNLSILPVNDAPNAFDNSEFYIANSEDNALNITVPTDPDTDNSTLVITVTGLPAGTIGVVTYADGTTPVTLGDTLTLAQLATLSFDAQNIDGEGQFTYTVFDGDETTTGITTINVGATDPDTGTVYESALANGTGSDGGSSSISGNVFDNDAAAGNSIDSVDFGANNYTAIAGVITITTALGTLTVHADNSTPGYNAGDYFYQLTSADASGADVTENFTYNFTNGVALSDTLTITIEDDEPVANNLVETVPESEEQIYNIILTLDISTSMNAAVSGTTRLELAKESLVSLSEAYFKQSSQVQVTVLLFANGAHELGTYTTFESAQAAINTVTDVNQTNYSNNLGNGNLTNSTSYIDATELIEDALTADIATQNPADGIQNISYFLSDGAVTADGTPVGNGFDDFVNNNAISSYSVGIGTGLPDDLTDLNYIHNIDSLGKGYGTINPALIVEDVSQLQSELLSTVPTAFGGNITVDLNSSVDNVLFGADTGYVESISLDLEAIDTNGDLTPTTFEFIYDGDTITVPASLAASVEIDGSIITFDANDGFTYGTFTFDFSDGSYTFSAPNGTAPATFDFDYTIIDGDGDTASATATIDIVDDSPEARDDLHSIDGNQIAEGNVITAIGTDGGPQFGLDYTPFASQGGGVDKIVDDAVVTEFTYKGETISLDLTLTTTTVTPPAPTGGSEDVAINSGTNFATTNVSLSANAGFNANGAGIDGGRNDATLDDNDRGAALTVSFNTTALPYGVDNLVLTMGDFQSDYGDAVTITVYDTTHTILGTVIHYASGGVNVDLSAYVGIGSVDIIYSGGGWDAQLANVEFDPAPAVPYDVSTLDQTSGDNGSNLSWVYSYDYDLDGNPVFDATVTDINDGSTFTMRSNGYYNYTPIAVQTVSSIDLTSQTNIDDSGLDISINPGNINISSTNGIDVDNGEVLSIVFDELTYGAQNVILTLRDFTSSGDQATIRVTHDTDGDGNFTTATLVFDASDGTELDLSAYTGVTQLEIESTSTNNNNPDLKVREITFENSLPDSGGIVEPILVDYTLTDTDDQSDSAQLAIYTINNEITGTVGPDSITGGTLNDAITGDTGDDVLSGGDGHDTLSGGAGADTLSGNAGNDYLSGGDDNDILDGGAGQDHLTGGAGDDLVDGGTGDDIVQGGSGNDLIFGGAGDDLLEGDEGDDTLYGGSGNDTLDGGEGSDIIDAGSGDDTIAFDGGDAHIDGGEGTDTLELTNTVLDFSNITNGTIENIETLNLNNSGSQEVSLTLDDVLDMTGAENVLEVTGGQSDVITLDVKGSSGTWTHQGNGLFSNGTDHVQIVSEDDPENQIHIVTDDGTPIG